MGTRDGRCRVRMLSTGVMLLVASGCTSMLVGGAAYESGDDERSQSAVASDAAITSEIRSRFAANPVVGMFNIGVRTYAGAVTLSGVVSNLAAQEQAGQIAGDADGVKTVYNRIKVEKR